MADSRKAARSEWDAWARRRCSVAFADQRPAPGDGHMSTSTTSRTARLAIPNQHGAWAFLLVPLILGFMVAGWSWLGLVSSAAWILAYPASYYLGRAVVIRWRRGTWSRLARRELGYARPWIVLAAIPSLVLVVMRPWLLAVGVALIVLWGVSVWLSRIGQERGASNDLLLVTQAALAVPLFYGIVHDAWPPSDAWLAAFVCLVFFTGSVLHVKSLIREADNPRWALASRVYNTASMGTAFVSPWLLLPFGAAAIRAFLVPSGTRPAVVGAVEIVVSTLVVIGTGMALS